MAKKYKKSQQNRNVAEFDFEEHELENAEEDYEKINQELDESIK